MKPREQIIAWREADASFFDPPRTVAAFSQYMQQEGSHFSRKDYAARLIAKCRLPGFRNDMAKVLAAGTPSDIDGAADRVQQILVARLD